MTAAEMNRRIIDWRIAEEREAHRRFLARQVLQRFIQENRVSFLRRCRLMSCKTFSEIVSMISDESEIYGRVLVHYSILKLTAMNTGTYNPDTDLLLPKRAVKEAVKEADDDDTWDSVADYENNEVFYRPMITSKQESNFVIDKDSEIITEVETFKSIKSKFESLSK
eukprot:768352-Hanusia_phi.AAC.2